MSAFTMDDLYSLMESTIRLGFDRVIIQDGEATLYRPESDEPFGALEYVNGSETRSTIELWEAQAINLIPEDEMIYLPYQAMRTMTGELNV